MEVLFNFEMKGLDKGIAERAAYIAQQHLAQAMAERGKKILDMEFTIEGTIEGTPWAPLAKSTRDRKGFDAVLWETGDLMKSIFVKKTPTGWSFGVESDKFDPKLHEFGFVHKSGTWVPARPFIGPAIRQVNREMTQIAKPIIKEFTAELEASFVKVTR